MGVLSLATTYCNKLQIGFESGLNPSLLQTKRGFLEALMTDVNLSGGVQKQEKFDQNSGIRATVYQNYYRRELETNVKQASVDGQPNICATPAQKAKFQTTFEFDPANTLYYQFSITDAQMRQFCANDTKTDDMMMNFASSINAFYDKINTWLFNRYLVLRGTFTDATTVKSGNAFTSGILDVSNNSIMSEMERQFDDMDMNDEPFIVGWNAIKDYYSRGKYGCCNTSQGIDVAAATGYGKFFMDKKVALLQGANINRFAAFLPKTIIPIQFRNYAGDFEVRGSAAPLSFNEFQHTNTEIVDYSQNFNVAMPFDISLRYNNCGRDSNWTVTLMKDIDLLVTIPSDSFQATDKMVGVNGAVIFNATQS